jgi:hypothetical protein
LIDEILSKMSLTIQIYHLRDTKVFYGGEEVAGFVEATGPMKIPVGKLEFKFAAYSETMQKRDRFPVDDKTVFHEHSEILFEGDLEMANGDVKTWPFNVRLPVETEPRGATMKIKYSKRNEYQKASHQIPASVALQGNSPHAWTVHIRYNLQAMLRGRPGMKYDLVSLTVVPRPPAHDGRPLADAQLIQYSKSFMHKSSKLLGGQADRRRSIAKWFGDKLGSDAPCFAFSIIAQTSPTLTPGGAIPMRLQLVFNPEQSNVPAPPPVHLLELNYRIWAATYVLSRSTFGSEIHTAAHEIVFARGMRFASQQLVEGEMASFGTTDPDTGTLRDLSFEAALIPPFSTYNASRGYDAEIEIQIEFSGKKMGAKFKFDPIAINYNEHHSERPATQFKPVENEMLEGKMLLRSAGDVANMLIQTLI